MCCGAILQLIIMAIVCESEEAKDKGRDTRSCSLPLWLEGDAPGSNSRVALPANKHH